MQTLDLSGEGGPFEWRQKRADAGFPGETEVMTTGGPTRIDELEIGQFIYSLNPMTGLVKPKQLEDIQRLDFRYPFVSLQTRRADLRLHPDQPVPYTTPGSDEVRYRRAGDLTDQRSYRFINDWHYLHGEPLAQIDITTLLDNYEVCVTTEGHGFSFRRRLPDGCEPINRNGCTGYHFDAETFEEYQSCIEAIADRVSIRGGKNQRRRPYKFDGDDFIRLLGWYVTEGSITDYEKTTEVKIAQKTPKQRDSIEALFDRLGIAVSISNSGFSVGATVFAELLEKLCGRGCRDKHLPAFIWTLSQSQKALLLEVLLQGDGNTFGTYYTASRQLAMDVLCLCFELGIKPRYTTRGEMWQIYTGQTNDGFDSTKHIDTVWGPKDMYQLTLTDYNSVLVGNNGRFQWIGVSNIA